jgi:hypothetical protein
MTAFETPEPVTADVRLGLGHVLISASERTDTVVEIRPYDPADDRDVAAAERTEVGFADGRLTVRGPEKKWSWGRPGAIAVTVHLPAGSRVEAAGAASFHCDGPLGDTTVKTQLGDISVDEALSVRASTACGNVWVGRADGPARIRSSNGEIQIGEAGGPIDASTSNGSISVGEAGDTARLRTACGDLTVGIAAAHVDAKTAYGRVTVNEQVVRNSYGYYEPRAHAFATTVTSPSAS